MSGKKIFVGTCAFVIAFGVGFLASMALRGEVFVQNRTASGFSGGGGGSIIERDMPTQRSQTPAQPRTTPSQDTPGSRSQAPSQKPSAPETAPAKPAAPTAPTISRVDGPNFGMKTRVYTVNVHATTASGSAKGLEYTAYDSKGKRVATGQSPKMTLPQSEDGVYYIEVKDTSTGAKSARQQVRGCKEQRMSKARLEAICNSGDYTNMRNVEAYQLSPDISLSFEGVGQDEYASSIDDICTRISMNIWKSVTITEITWDDLNLVKTVKFRVTKI